MLFQYLEKWRRSIFHYPYFQAIHHTFGWEPLPWSVLDGILVEMSTTCSFQSGNHILDGKPSFQIIYSLLIKWKWDDSSHLPSVSRFKIGVRDVRDEWITFMVSSCLVSAAEYRFKDFAEDITSRCTTLNYLNETSIRLLVFPLDTFTLPLETSKFWRQNFVKG